VKATFVNNPFPHCLVEDVFPAELLPYITQDLIRSRMEYKTPDKSGSARNADGSPMKRNKALFLPQNNSSLTKIAFDKFWGKDTMELFNQIPEEHSWWKHCFWRQNSQSYMVSEYSHGDSYPSHWDNSFFTILLWFYPEPKPFSGGELTFTDYDVTLECKNNTGVIFFGPEKHEVSEVQGNGRYTLTIFSQNLTHHGKQVEPYNPRN
jgi:hypothetical protein